ncbi:MAG: hypothetical protein ACLQVI_14240 [Polyangiaceae bacterium]
MQRTILLASILAPTLLACAHARTSSTTAAPRPPDPPGLAVSYRMLRVGDGDGVVLAGRSLIDSHRSVRVDSVPAHSRGNENLELVARQDYDGTMIVQVSYHESNAEGAVLDWRPSMRLARGTTTRTEVNGNGWGRVLEIAVE